MSEKEFRKHFDDMRRSIASRSDKKRKTSNETEFQNQFRRHLMGSQRIPSPRDSKRPKVEDGKSFRQNHSNLSQEERLGLIHLEKMSKSHKLEEVLDLFLFSIFNHIFFYRIVRKDATILRNKDRKSWSEKYRYFQYFIKLFDVLKCFKMFL